MVGGTMRLSVAMPAFNEELTIALAIRELLAVELPCPMELIVVDDGSVDRTAAILADLDDPRVQVVRHRRNQGKGAALMTAAEAASGTHLLPFDADREYDPRDIPRLIEPVIAGRATVVFGARRRGQNTVFQSLRYAAGNRALTMAANLLFDAAVSDLHTCLKLVPLPFFRSLHLEERGFGLDSELAAAILRSGARPFEVPVSYYARSHDEGKKITWKDGVHCLRVLAAARVDRGRVSAPEAPTPWRTADPSAERRWRPRFAVAGPDDAGAQEEIALERAD